MPKANGKIVQVDSAEVIPYDGETSFESDSSEVSLSKRNVRWIITYLKYTKHHVKGSSSRSRRSRRSSRSSRSRAERGKSMIDTVIWLNYWTKHFHLVEKLSLSHLHSYSGRGLSQRHKKYGCMFWTRKKRASGWGTRAFTMRTMFGLEAIIILMTYP